jgi:hypothetical protein
LKEIVAEYLLQTGFGIDEFRLRRKIARCGEIFASLAAELIVPKVFFGENNYTQYHLPFPGYHGNGSRFQLLP